MGNYVPGDSILHRLDPRTKILALLLYGAGILAAYTPGKIYLLGAAGLLAVKGSGLPARYLASQLKSLILFLVILVFLEALLVPGSEAARLGPLVLSREGLYQGFVAAGRVIFLLVGAVLLTATTSPLSLAQGLEALLGPGKKLGLPVEEFSFMFTLALRFVPTLLEEADRIVKSQAARGISLEGKNLFKRGMGLLPLLIPLLVSTFKRAEDLAQALEARGYQPGRPRTRRKPLRMGYRDWLFLLGVSALVALVCLWP